MKLPDIPAANYAPPLINPGMINANGENLSGQEKQDFPTLLNIEWPANGGVASAELKPDILLEAGLLADGQVGDPVNGLLPQEAEAASAGPIANPKIADIVAGNLLFNSQFNVSVQATATNDAVSEAKILIEDFNRAIANAASLVKKTAAMDKNTGDGTANLQQDASQLGSAKANTALPSGGVGREFNQILPKVEAHNQLQAVAANIASAKSGVNLQQAEPVRTNNTVSINQISTQANAAQKISVMNSGGENQIQFPSQVSVAALPEVISRISSSLEAQEISRTPGSNPVSASTVSSNVKVVELQLVPKSLGVVELKIVKTDHGAQIMIQVESAEAERVLMAERATVYEAMRNAGMSVEEMKVTFSPRSEQENNGSLNKENGAAFQQLERDREAQEDMQFDDDHGSENGMDQSSVLNGDDQETVRDHKPVGLYF